MTNYQLDWTIDLQEYLKTHFNNCPSDFNYIFSEAGAVGLNRRGAFKAILLDDGTVALNTYECLSYILKIDLENGEIVDSVEITNGLLVDIVKVDQGFTGLLLTADQTFSFMTFNEQLKLIQQSTPIRFDSLFDGQSVWNIHLSENFFYSYQPRIYRNNEELIEISKRSLEGQLIWKFQSQDISGEIQRIDAISKDYIVFSTRANVWTSSEFYRVHKINEHGEYTKGFLLGNIRDELDQVINVQEDVHGNIYSVHSHGIKKFNREGNLIWQKLLGDDEHYLIRGEWASDHLPIVENDGIILFKYNVHSFAGSDIDVIKLGTNGKVKWKFQHWEKEFAGLLYRLELPDERILVTSARGRVAMYKRF